MSKYASVRRGIALSVASCILLFSAGCSSAASTPSDTSSTTNQQESTPIVVSEHVSSANANFSLEDCWANADLICVATYKDSSEPFAIRPVDGGDPQLFTDLHFDISQTYLGSASSDDSSQLTVRQMGGTGQYVEVVNDDALVPKDGSSYLLFLYKIDNGAEYNTEGDHYYLIGGNQGAWADDGTDTYASPTNGDKVSVDDLVAMQDAKGSAPQVQHDQNTQYLDELQSAYTEGRIDRDYLDAAKDKIELENSQYATVMSKAETLAYETEMIGRAGTAVESSSD